MAGIQVIHVKCYLRYQEHDIQHGDDMILVATSNHAGGTTVLVVQEDKSGDPQSYLKVIGQLDRRDVHIISGTARSQNLGVHRPRAGPRVGSSHMPDLAECTVAMNSPQYHNVYPPNFGHIGGLGGPPGGRPYILLRCECRV